MDSWESIKPPSMSRSCEAENAIWWSSAARSAEFINFYAQVLSQRCTWRAPSLPGHEHKYRPLCLQLTFIAALLLCWSFHRYRSCSHTHTDPNPVSCLPRPHSGASLTLLFTVVLYSRLPSMIHSFDQIGWLNHKLLICLNILQGVQMLQTNVYCTYLYFHSI